jgi:alpha-D-xyloside xylohydrolase
MPLTTAGYRTFPKVFSLSGAKVVYEGYLQAPVDNNYHFILYYAGYIKVYLGGKLVVPERWRTAWNPNAWKFIFHLKKGLKVPVRIEWSPDGDVSYCGLRAATPESDVEQGKLSIWSEMSRDIDYYFVAGENLDDVISGYRTLTGKAPVYPKWTLGFWQSRERYHNSSEVEQTMAEFRKRHIPVDNIVQDWNYWKIDSWGDHTFEAARYPNPQAMLDSVHQLHGRFMISVWPKFYTTVKNYKELDSHGWIYHQAVEDSIKDWLGYTGSFYDAYAPGARQMFWNQLNDSLYSKYHFGIDAWWMDASEPNVRDCTPMWYRKALVWAYLFGFEYGIFQCLCAHERRGHLQWAASGESGSAGLSSDTKWLRRSATLWYSNLERRYRDPLGRHECSDYGRTELFLVRTALLGHGYRRLLRGKQVYGCPGSF